mgnify:CR=1 FL=1
MFRYDILIYLFMRVVEDYILKLANETIVSLLIRKKLFEVGTFDLIISVREAVPRVSLHQILLLLCRLIEYELQLVVEKESKICQRFISLINYILIIL